MLNHSQRQDLALVHIEAFDAISKGKGTEILLFQAVSAALLWRAVAGLTKVYEYDMGELLLLYSDVVNRYEITGKIVFTGPEYVKAKAGLALMDHLGTLIDQPAASKLAQTAEDNANKLFELSRARIARAKRRVSTAQLANQAATAVKVSELI